MRLKFPKLLKDYLIIIFAYLLVLSIARAVFFWAFKDGIYATGEILKSFLIGVRIDLSLTAVAVSFVYFILSIFSFFLRTSAIPKIIGKIYFSIVGFAFFFFTFTEFPFYKEYHLRLNHLFFEYLDSKELLITVNAVFPVIYAVLIFIVAAFVITFLTVKFMEKINLFAKERFLKSAFSFFAIIALTVIFIRGGFQRRPINWGAAYFSKSNFLNQNASNGMFNLFHDFQIYLEERKSKIKAKSYFSNRNAYDAIVGFNDYEQETKKLPFKLPVKKPNIVMIFMEGFDTTYNGSFSPKLALTPNFDGLAKKGILFTKAYSNGTRTSRALVGGLCSYPVTPGVNLTKKIQAQQKIPSVADYLAGYGYKSLFLFGGDRDFEDIGAFFTSNGFKKFYDYEDLGPTDCPHKMAVFDEELFTRANEKFSQIKNPFIAVIMTKTNHEPFYLPKHFKDIKKGLKIDKRVFHYTDWSLGHFFKEAEKEKYFKNTVFIIAADHTRYTKELNQNKFHIPLLIYSPMIKGGKKIDKTVSLMNLPKTILQICGINLPVSKTSFFSKSLFENPYAAYVMVDPYFGVVTDKYFYRESLSEDYYLFDFKGKVLENGEKIPPLQDYARAMLQVSRYLFLNFKVNTDWEQRKQILAK